MLFSIFKNLGILWVPLSRTWKFFVLEICKGKKDISNFASTKSQIQVYMRKTVFILTAVAAFVNIPAIAGDIVYDGISYAVTDGTEVTATGFAGDANPNLVIPATFNAGGIDYTVVGVADQAFQFCNLSSASLPETLRTIGNSAFAFNMLMSQCSLPSGLQSVGDYAFHRCFRAVMNVKGLSYVGEGAFWECSKISEVVLDAEAEVGENAFMYCTGVKTLVLEGTPRSVGKCAFAFNSLQELTVKSAVPPSFVPEDVFCYGDNENRDYKWTLNFEDVALKVPAGSVDTYRTDRNWSIFSNVTEFAQDEISEFSVAPFEYRVTGEGQVSVKSIEGSATSCSIPSEVSYAGRDFAVMSVDDNAFANSAITEASIPGTVLTVGENAFINCSSLSEVSFGEGTVMVGKHAFSNTGLTSLSLPNSMKTVGEGAFMGCLSLSDITLPGGICLETLAFFNCSLTEITIMGTPASFEGASMASSTLRKITFHTDEVPGFLPEEVWLLCNGEFNDQVVLLVDNEDMAVRFKEVPAWNVFKAILPVGTEFNPDKPYLPENTLCDIEDVLASDGLKAFVPAEDSVRMLAAFELSCILWDGQRGMRVKEYSKRITMNNWWDSFNTGDYINGHIIGMMNAETDTFLSTSHSVEAVQAQEEMMPLNVTGSLLTQNEGGLYQYAYVCMTGSVQAESFRSEDGESFALRNLSNEAITTAKPCGYASVRGIYMHEKTPYGFVDALVVLDPDNFYNDLSGISDVEAEVDEKVIYSISGVALGSDANALVPGLYVRNGKKFIIR